MALEAVDTRARGLRTRARRRTRSGSPASSAGSTGCMIAAVAGLVAYGLWAIDGITLHDPGGSAVGRQARTRSRGALLALVAIAIDPDVLPPLEAAALRRHDRRHARRARSRARRRAGRSAGSTSASFRFQPSEFGKVLFALALAAFLADRGEAIGELRTVAAGGRARRAAARCSSSSSRTSARRSSTRPSLAARALRRAASAGRTSRSSAAWSLTVALLVLWVLPAAGIDVLKPYQEERLTGFLHPDSDPRGTTYNISQSITTRRRRRVRGRGVAGATQTSLNYLPEHRTDFVFASFAEQRGFLGASILLLLYLLVVWRGLR